MIIFVLNKVMLPFISLFHSFPLAFLFLAFPFFSILHFLWLINFYVRGHPFDNLNLDIYYKGEDTDQFFSYKLISRASLLHFLHSRLCLSNDKAHSNSYSAFRIISLSVIKITFNNQYISNSLLFCIYLNLYIHYSTKNREHALKYTQNCAIFRTP